MNQNRSLEWIPPWTQAVAAMLLVQLAAALSVPLIDVIGPAATAWLRLAFGALIVLCIARPKLRSIRRRDIPALLGLGIVTGGNNMFFLFAIERLPLGTAVAVEFLGPLVVAGIASKSLRAFVWPVMALGGVVLLTEPWHGQADVIGIAFALASGACWGLYIVFTQFVGDRYSGISGLAVTFPIAVVCTAPVGVPPLFAHQVPLWGVAAAAGIALLSPVMAFGLEMLALRRMTQNAFGTLLSIEPAFAMLIGMVALQQWPTAMKLAGIALVVLAGAAAQRSGKRVGAAETEVR
ncbi:EamA family transporter [Leucobacter sp. gxy201]|uniref:EamA family transporter n=1 Tax=Leucobacter sp. gxy201 TaxID=2957200 RepID=UPI003DA1B2FF